MRQDVFEYQWRYDCSIFRRSPALFMSDSSNDRTTAVSYKILEKWCKTWAELAS